MSAIESPDAVADNAPAPLAARPTFAERFYWLGILANALAVIAAAMGTLSFTRSAWGISHPSHSCLAWGFVVVMATHMVGWSALVAWRHGARAWAGLVVPVISIAPAVTFATWVDSNNLSATGRLLDGSGGILAVYLLIFGLMRIWGVRLLSPSLLTQNWIRGKISLRMLVPLFAFGIIYSYAANDLERDGPLSRIVLEGLGNTGLEAKGLMRREKAALIIMTSVVAIAPFVLSLTSYVGWSLTLAGGIVTHVLSSRITSTNWLFTFDDNKHATYYLGTILLFTAAMTLPWLLLGWRVVWTPPLWDRTWRKSPATTGEAT
jgi:hypothetical protein